ncbi:hypothetical protein [Pedobacter cryoconitis]|uniref:hypothetical protein n=1 Tax=Pedobacter cryoconitis TaxID=188932 RepID=UPI00162044D0|nr:hypothetical protein [Pedobacter cryoconitis]MBB5649142.1 hypothetical protein [Pedobacter cryoconitis]
MKIHYSLIAALLLSSTFYAAGQTNKLLPDGNVGIGTTSPEGKLQIIGNEEDPNGKTLIIGNYSSTNLRLGYNADYSWLQGHGGRPLYINYLGNNVVFNLRGGNVGIGTAAPEGKLHIVNGDGTGVSSLVIGPYDSSNLRFGYNPGYTWLQANGGRPLYINELGNDVIFNLNGGNVGIGIVSPKNKLSVNGTVRANEIKVSTEDWPDYVFEKQYEHKSLTELAAYIKLNKRLPEMPSAKEAETNGIELGKMNKLLLKKVEELTLHLIAQNEKISRQESAQAELRKLFFKMSKEIKRSRKPL